MLALKMCYNLINHGGEILRKRPGQRRSPKEEIREYIVMEIQSGSYNRIKLERGWKRRVKEELWGKITNIIGYLKNHMEVYCRSFLI